MSNGGTDDRDLQELAGDLALWFRRQAQLGLRSIPKRSMPRPQAPRSQPPVSPQAAAATQQPATRPAPPPRPAPKPAPSVSAEASGAEPLGRRIEELSQSLSQTLAASRPVAPTQPSASRASTLEELRVMLGDCRRCGLCESRGRIVFGEGAERARVMFITDMPTAAEDSGGPLLGGEEGQLLDRMLQAMGLSRSEVYMTGSVKCRSAGGRRPSSDEAKKCRSVLAAQLRIVAPQAVVVLGGAALAALKPDERLTAEDRGKWMELNGVPMMPTYHPALLLQKPELKRAAWQDLKQVMDRLSAR